MKEWKEYKGHKATEKTIYTLDIETTSYFVDSKGNIHTPKDYRDYKKDSITIGACMYIWMVSINQEVYYGRTYDELDNLLILINNNDPKDKIFWIHNFQFEFEFLRNILDFTDVFARNSHRPITAKCEKYNIIFRCSYQLSHVRLELLPELYNLPARKLTGDLDYNKLRTPETPLTAEELAYCEADCLVLYQYILSEMQEYGTQNSIPLTATGKVRRALHEAIDGDIKYRLKISDACDIDPIVYNRLVSSMAGGCVMANDIYRGEHLKNVVSVDEASAYTYVLVTEKFPSGGFKKVEGKLTVNNLCDKFAYILHVRIKNIRSRYANCIMPFSKTLRTRGVVLNDCKVSRCEELDIICTDVDLKVYMQMYGSGRRGEEPLDVEILEAYYSKKKRLPKQLIVFILDMYEKKTQYKGIKEKYKEYQLIKSMFNSIYGMCITNDIRDVVAYGEDGWHKKNMENKEIKKRLRDKKREGFLPFSAGVWCSAYARRNLAINMMTQDDYLVYCDTDCLKLLEDYDTQGLKDYNASVIEKLKSSSNYYGIPYEMYAPADINGKIHPMGLFEVDAIYDDFITTGPKAYAAIENGQLEITLSGVPKEGVACLKDIDDFKDGKVFTSEVTKKCVHFYCDNMDKINIIDYFGHIYTVADKSGIALMPTDYILGADNGSMEFDSSERARYDEA